MTIKFEDQDPPRPPDLLIDRVTPGVSAETAETDRLAFDASGQRSVRDLEVALSSVDRELGSFARILDFGCGCARVTRWLGPLAPMVELHGCDIDEQAIAWDAANLPFCTFSRNPTEPPLPYPDEHFDLIVNHSVFTHLDERMQDLWLQELRRVLRPEGLALVSVHGQRAFDLVEQQTISPPHIRRWREGLETRGIVFIVDDTYIGSSFPDFYHTTFHAPWYVFEHWAQWFEIRAFLPRADLDHQDMVIMQKVAARSSGSVLRARPQPQPAANLPGPDAVPLKARVRGTASSLARRGTAKLARRFPPAPASGANETELARQANLALVIAKQQGERISRLEAMMMDNRD
jgi:SAM-dependent methyltransferase